MEGSRKIPAFYGFRIYFTSSLLYFLLVLPFAGFLVLQNLPALIEKSETLMNPAKAGTEIMTNDSIPAPGQQGQNNMFKVEFDDQQISDDQIKLINKTFNFLFNVLLVSFLAGFIFNYPFKRYFRRKRNNKKISDRLFSFCKRYILLSPWINAGILGAAFVASLVYMLVITSAVQSSSGNGTLLFNRFFLISFFSTLLTVLFIYFWEKHRVHIKYLDHLFAKEELRKRVFKLGKGKIRNRFWISSAMTTLLPLSIVIVYLIMSVTRLSDLNLETLSEEQIKILFGRYSNMMTMIVDRPDPTGDLGGLPFVNMLDSLIMFFGIGLGIFVSFIYIILFVKWTTLDIVHPVKELIYNMQRTGERKNVNYTVVRNNDEIGELAEGYNDMAARIEQYIANISKMNEAYFRFVPKQFLDILGKSSITEILLGDQVQKEMSVLFTDIRSFTALSEEMTPKETFDFLNEYLSLMEPVISRNHGFIDKYIGDSIMALFMGNVENAVDAAIEMRVALADFNLKRKLEGKKSIQSGIGINTGNLMLGIVGGHGRMDGTVVSDAVNLASRIEGLTTLYGASIIISQDTLIKLEDPSRYNYRFLDVVKVKGKKEAVYIFEILDGEPADSKNLKVKTKQDFGKALQLYKNKDFDTALQYFRRVHEENPADKATQLYLARCNNIIEFGLPEDWDGVETLKDKF
jgi:class 3 adenylate cyclase